ncbi:MAG: formyltransferase family protein [Peptostreptococcaceae bacterium]|nr:formyltransferase family protein [Peptostreptococcaceae bacterium]
MRIFFIGNVFSSKVFLETLISLKSEIVGVLSLEDTGFNSDYKDLSELCQEEGVDFCKVSSIGDPFALSFVREKQPDIIYCFGFSQLLPREILRIPRMGTVGYHPAALPNNRGRHPIIWALALGLSKTASTFFWIDEGVDTGSILSQEEVEILYEDDAASLYEKLLCKGREQVAEFTKHLSAGELKGNEAKEDKGKDKVSFSQGNVWRKRGAEDGRIDFRMSSGAIYNLVRALTRPYAGAHFRFQGRDVKVWKVEEVPIDGMENIEPGKVLAVYSKKSFLVKCHGGCVRVLDCDELELKEGEYIL